MNIPIRAGVLLGVLCVIWTFVMGFTGGADGWILVDMLRDGYSVVLNPQSAT